MQPTDFALIVAAARREVEKALASHDRSALAAFAPSFAIKEGRLVMQHGGNVADLGDVIGPRGIDGFNGIDGTDAAPALDGKDGLNGENGRDGLDGKDGRDGADGVDGRDGADGVSIANAYISDTGFLIIELTDGRKITAGHVRAKDGKDGVTSYAYIGGGAGSGGSGGGSVSWNDIPDKPDTFPPSAHTQDQSTINGLVDDLAAKQATLVSGTNIKTVNGNSLLGAGDLVIAGGGGATNLSYDAATRTIASDTGTDAVLPVADGANAGLMASANFTKLAAITGTNTGDQTSIVGITGTKSQFNTAVTDGDILYVGDVTSNATHTGDVTGATVLTIANDIVTNAKLANMGANSIKGAVSAGDPVDLTPAQVRTIINVADGAQANVPTDLIYTAATRVIASSTGADAVLPLATTTDAGLAPARSGNAAQYLDGTGVYSTPAGGGGSAIAVQDEGSNITTALATLNFTGAGVTVTGGATAVVNVPAAPASIVSARIYRNTNQSIPGGGVFANLVWSTAAYEIGGDVWTSGDTVTIAETGLTRINIEATFDGTELLTIATSNMELVLNGSTIIGEDEVMVAIGAKGSLNVMAQRNFTAGDTLIVRVKHSDAGSLNILAQSDHSPDIILTKVGGAKGDPGAGGGYDPTLGWAF